MQGRTSCSPPSAARGQRKDQGDHKDRPYKTMKPSRRDFIKSAFVVPLAAPLGARLGHLCALIFAARPAGLTASGQAQFENPHIIRYDASCFTINGRDAFIASAAFHYPRCPRSLWRDRLLKLQRAGFNTIETYVFWNYHEPEEGRADLSEFEEFIKLVKEMGFWMIARPGPYVCAEWERGGFPDWVAAKRFLLRSNHPESIRTSHHWFNLVLPVIQRHQVTLGGPIIMMQLENEYDYCSQVPEAEKREYLRALAQMAWNAAIDVPLITCWTKPARENSNADMARIMDTCNFYPRWDIVKDVPPALEKLRREEPTSPVAVTELQGGWFSQFGGKLSVDQEGVNGAQFNMLAKTAMERGVTYFNVYMGFGGTNFDWAAKTMTTTYDYAAPLREPGGLWEKYYAARGVCESLRMFGAVLSRAQIVEGATQSANASVSVAERATGKSAVVFIRENANAEQHFKMTFRVPASPTRRAITAPREGELTLGPREMKMLPVQVPIAGAHLRYSTAEVLAHGLNLDRHYLIVYDEPGRLVEIGLATEDEPHVEGETVYQYWDQEYESVVIGARVEKTEKLLLVNNHLLVIIVARERALRSWTADFPSKVIPGSEETKPMSVPFIGDGALMASSGSRANRIWAEFDFLPGEHELTVLLPPLPSKCRVDGVLRDFQYDRHWRTARLHISTPAIPYRPAAIDQVRAWVERFDRGAGQWLKSPARPLEELGRVPYGYVKYRAQFPYNGEPKMFLSSFADDAKKVFLNGKLLRDALNSKKQVEFLLSSYAHPGINSLEIIYEAFGSPNFGENLGDLKGIESVRYGRDLGSARTIESWEIQRVPPPMRGREVDPDLSTAGWMMASLSEPGPAKGSAALAPESKEFLPAFTWCRAEFAMEKPAEDWSIPWKLTFEADCDALLYLNGKFVGRYVSAGPQKDFYLPEPYLVFGGRKNLLTVVLAYVDNASPIRTLRVAPYEEFSTRRTRVEFEW